LDAADPKAAHIAMVVFGGCTAQIAQQIEYRVFGNSAHAACGVDGYALD
jgi:hypothetical protein